MSTIIDLVSQWLKEIPGRICMSREWLHADDMSLYIRCSSRYHEDRFVTFIDLASITSIPTGKGIFTGLLTYLHAINPYDGIYIECVQEQRFQDYLQRIGFRVSPIYPDSFILLKTQHLEI